VQPCPFKNDGHSNAVPQRPGQSGFFVGRIDDFLPLTVDHFRGLLAQAMHSSGAALDLCQLEMS
jgi:hypothetical protein